VSVLIATDFSSCSRAAVRLAAAIARGKGVPLIVVHAIDPLVLQGNPIGLSVIGRDFTAAAESLMAEEVEALRGESTEVEVVMPFGAPFEVIREAVAAKRPELVVLGTHGRRGAARFFVGSVAEAVVREARCPVLVTCGGAPDLARWSGQGALRIAVATDGSAAGRAALSWTRDLAQSRSCEVDVVRMYAPAEAARHYGLDDPWVQRAQGSELAKLVERDAHKEAEELFEHAPKVRLRATANDTGDALAAEAALLGVDAVVIGIPQRRFPRTGMIAPATVLRAASVPILCVPESLAPAQNGLPSTSSILLPTDFSDSSLAAILPAYGLLGRSGGRVELCTVHVILPASGQTIPASPPLTFDERAALEARLHGLVPPAAEAAGIATNVSVLEAASVPDAILAAAERLDVDLVALGSHGRAGFRRAVLGSVADEVARRCARPVLIVSARRRGDP
jgi:nucleotide-binding universal stress UspA family protein